ncbi:nuclear transport factor 2 family protein [Neptunomonas sp.]|uniref:nuclear transport factor 2 family protein n=1 Tax=Neptunomonas sp. TaxID=1971898 RepID=UPI003564A07B
MMEDIHPNLSLLNNLNLQDLDACRSILADNFVWHYFNRHIPDLEGDYRGVDGLKSFFAKLGERSDSSFRVNVIDIRTAGDELVVTQVCNSMNLEGSLMEFDAVVVWRIVNGQVAEAWDIPAVNTIRSVEKS